MKEIYVGNLAYSVTEDDLRQYFGQYGSITNAKLIKDRATDRSKGFGFVEYTSEEEAKKAVDANGQELKGRPIRVNISRPRERTGGGAGAGAGRRGDRRF